MKKLKNKRVAILGFGLEGKDLADFLLRNDAKVSVFDKKDENEINFRGTDKKRLNLFLGDKYDLTKLKDYDIVYRSPGVYRYQKEIIAAEEKGVVISSATKLFFENSPAKIIGVTGTKGKGTTASLIYEILKKAGKSVFLAGNIGTPYLSLLEMLTEDDLVVLELSSFQLIDLDMSPHVSVVLNITEDHLDWHKDKEEYVDAKKPIVKNQTKDDFSVINHDYDTPKSFAELTKAKKYYFSRKEEVKGVFVRDSEIFLNIKNEEVLVGKVDDLLLRGEHNYENVTAAICAASLAGADIKSIKEATFTFRGLEHRLEFVAEVEGVGFYNDSFATGPQPTIAAIKSFNEPTTLILGGSEKGLSYKNLADEIVKKDSVKNVILIGEVADKIKKELDNAGFEGEIHELGKSEMDKIVKTSLEKAKKGGVVLLSPASASFDMFDNYKERGDLFKGAVIELKGGL